MKFFIHVTGQVVTLFHNLFLLNMYMVVVGKIFRGWGMFVDIVVVISLCFGSSPFCYFYFLCDLILAMKLLLLLLLFMLRTQWFYKLFFNKKNV